MPGVYLGKQLGTYLGGGLGSSLERDGLVADWDADTGVSPGATMTWTSSVGGFVANQATAGFQPTQVTVSELSNRPALRFDGVDDRLVSTAAASSWAFLHNGGGCEVYIVAVSRASTSALRFWLSTATTATTDTGVSFGNWGPATNLAGLYVVDGDGVNRTITSEPSTTSSIQDLPTIYAYSYQESVTPEYTHRRNGVTLATGSSISAPSAGAPTSTLVIGCSGASANFGHVDIAKIVIYNKVLSAASRQLNAAYFKAKYGIIG